MRIHLVRNKERDMTSDPDPPPSSSAALAGPAFDLSATLQLMQEIHAAEHEEAKRRERIEYKKAHPPSEAVKERQRQVVKECQSIQERQPLTAVQKEKKNAQQRQAYWEHKKAEHAQMGWPPPVERHRRKKT